MSGRESLSPSDEPVTLLVGAECTVPHDDSAGKPQFYRIASVSNGRPPLATETLIQSHSARSTPCLPAVPPESRRVRYCQMSATGQHAFAGSRRRRNTSGHRLVREPDRYRQINTARALAAIGDTAVDSARPCHRRMKRLFTAVFRRVPEGCIGFVEKLPGANTPGATLDEARANLHEAVLLVLEPNRELAQEAAG